MKRGIYHDPPKKEYHAELVAFDTKDSFNWFDYSDNMSYAELMTGSGWDAHLAEDPAFFNHSGKARFLLPLDFME